MGSERTPGRRLGVAAVVAVLTRHVVLVVAVVAVAGIALWRWREARSEARALAGRVARQTAVAVVAPAPLPSALPLVGPEGTTDDGYPRRSVDRAALRSLLHHGRHTELTQYVERFHTEAESDPRKEYWALDSIAAFDSAEPELRTGLDDWVDASPASFAPRLARGTYLTAVGFARRGAKPGDQTAPSDHDLMTDAMAGAQRDLRRAIELRPKALAAYRCLLQIDAATGNRDALQRDVFAANAACPACFQIRATFLLNDVPRWGGSYAEMRAAAAAAPVAENRRLALLAGYVDLDQADVALRAGKLGEASEAIARATALGEHWEFLLLRGKIRARKGDLVGAVSDVDRALELRPGQPVVLFERASLHDKNQEWEASGRALLTGMRVDATSPLARHLAPRAVQGLVHEAAKEHEAHRSAAALRMLDLAGDLAPSNGDVQRWRAAALLGPSAKTAAVPAAPSADVEDLATLEARATGAPDDFDAHRALDYGLARRNEYARVVAMWNDYIARNPREGRAYLERGGAHFHLHHLDEARADVTKACDLGVSEGCARMKQLPAR